MPQSFQCQSYPSRQLNNSQLSSAGLSSPPLTCSNLVLIEVIRVDRQTDWSHTRVGRETDWSLELQQTDVIIQFVSLLVERMDFDLRKYDTNSGDSNSKLDLADGSPEVLRLSSHQPVVISEIDLEIVRRFSRDCNEGWRCMLSNLLTLHSSGPPSGRTDLRPRPRHSWEPGTRWPRPRPSRGTPRPGVTQTDHTHQVGLPDLGCLPVDDLGCSLNPAAGWGWLR